MIGEMKYAKKNKLYTMRYLKLNLVKLEIISLYIFRAFHIGYISLILVIKK